MEKNGLTLGEPEDIWFPDGKNGNHVVKCGLIVLVTEAGLNYSISVFQLWILRFCRSKFSLFFHFLHFCHFICCPDIWFSDVSCLFCSGFLPKLNWFTSFPATEHYWYIFLGVGCLCTVTLIRKETPISNKDTSVHRHLPAAAPVLLLIWKNQKQEQKSSLPGMD